jgi:hypothetical protein
MSFTTPWWKHLKTAKATIDGWVHANALQLSSRDLSSVKAADQTDYTYAHNDGTSGNVGLHRADTSNDNWVEVEDSANTIDTSGL